MLLLLLLSLAVITLKAQAKFADTIDLASLDTKVSNLETDGDALDADKLAIISAIATSTSKAKVAITTALYDTFSQNYGPSGIQLSDLEFLSADISVMATSRLPTMMDSIRGDVSQRIAQIAANRKNGLLDGIVNGATSLITSGVDGLRPSQTLPCFFV